MDQYLLHAFGIFLLGLLIGVGLTLLFNKMRNGSASPSKIKQEYEQYQSEVESHFEETSKKFKEMTEQYQDLYKHLSVGATSLCRPDSVAATLADESHPMRRPPKLEQSEVSDEKVAAVDSEKDKKVTRPSTKKDKEPSARKDKEPSAKKDKEPSAKKDKEPSAKQEQLGNKDHASAKPQDKVAKPASVKKGK